MNLKSLVCTQASAEVIRILDAMESDGTAADRHGFEFPYSAYETLKIEKEKGNIATLDAL